MGDLLKYTEAGDHRQALQAAAEMLAARIEASAEAGSGTLAQEVAQYRQTMAEIAALPAPVVKRKGNVIDANEARARRDQRRAAATAEPATGTGGRKRR